MGQNHDPSGETVAANSGLTVLFTVFLFASLINDDAKELHSEK